MRINTTRERLAKGEIVYGCGLQVYRAPEIPRLFAAAGFDYVFIDLEHGSFNLELASGSFQSHKAMQGKLTNGELNEYR